MFDPKAPTPEMSVDISLGDFHKTHQAAFEARKLIEKGIEDLSVGELQKALVALEAGQNLSQAEIGDDFMDAPSYFSAIKLAAGELKKRREE